ncbi:MAG: integration host factor [Planctomycetota bacterium]|nr:MAG: integration host factor [Planctomycetota bacterium]
MAKKAAKKTARKISGKKTAARKPAARKTTAKKAAPAAKKPAKITGAKGKPRTKSEVMSVLAEHAGISKKEVAAVFDAMGSMIAADLSKGNAGTFNVPGLMKVTVVRKPATKARKGINPFTGEETTFKAKPARNVVKIRPLKGLKDMVA